MYYSIEELVDKMDEKMASLGINPKFKENPAYKTILNDFKNLISQMSLLPEIAPAILATEENGTISFNYTSKLGDKYSLRIDCANPEEFRCVITEEKKPFNNGENFVRTKNIMEEVATLGTDGMITLHTNGALVDDLNCDIGTCNTSNWAEEATYTADGIMMQLEHKTFPRGNIMQHFDSNDINSVLYTSRSAFVPGFISNSYETRTSLTRRYLDTADVIKEDKKKDIKYCASTPLNQEHGLQKMVLPGGYDPYPQNVVIQAISPTQIEEMIKKESDSKVQEGLRKLANGRENFYYSSEFDEKFVYSDLSQSQGFSK